MGARPKTSWLRDQWWWEHRWMALRSLTWKICPSKEFQVNWAFNGIKGIRAALLLRSWSLLKLTHDFRELELDVTILYMQPTRVTRSIQNIGFIKNKLCHYGRKSIHLMISTNSMTPFPADWQCIRCQQIETKYDKITPDRTNQIIVQPDARGTFEML